VTIDLVVVGAGIVGAVVAEEALRRAPSATVLLLDRARAGSGATRYSAALSTPTGATAAHRQLVERSERWYAHAARACGLERRPLLTFWVVSESEVEALREEFVSDAPVPASASDMARLRAVYPDLVVRSHEVVLRSKGAWAGAAEATARALAGRLNQTRSSACWEGVRVEAVQPEGDGQVVFTHTGERLSARHVVLATGAWLAADAGPGRAGWQLRVKKVAALHLARSPAADDPAVMFCDEDTFLLPLPEQRATLFSFPCATWSVRPGEHLVIERNELDAARASLAGRCASLAASVAGGRASCDGYLPGRLPSAAHDPGRPGVVLVGGGSGLGFSLAPALAEHALAGLDRFAAD
jgi:glycine/D-amino acid oxidase-like deaminating enzyme